ncbi:uncharacterized protein LOC143177090 [Calliopsis andreniformis]|uniref:uncharacterized protein LOC143177090 n=1 Tax=Calliopsis andreniformis TaxID=337506 RepID=UPI003FCCAE95
MEEFNCDIAQALQNRDFSVLQKLASYCCNFRGKVAAKVEEAAAYEIECIEKRTSNINKIAELQQEIENLKSEIDATKLNQKIIDKKILNAVKQQDKLKEEVEDAKLKRDNLSLEMVDLQQEYEKRKENKLKNNDALKRACLIYKQYLGIHIQLIDNTDNRQIRVSFFVNAGVKKETYFVDLCNSDSQWRVEQIQPVLKQEYLNDFKGIVDFSKNSEVLDVTVFLCKLRHIFIKYYLNTK